MFLRNVAAPSVFRCVFSVVQHKSFQECDVKKLLALTLALFCWASVALAAEKQVVVYNWTEFIPQDVLQDFEKETGVKVVYSIFESNESMFAKVKMLQGKGYDVIFPSSYFVDLMRKEGLLHKLDHARLPNLKHLDPALLDQAYDPGNQYSIPYMWGSLGLAYNSKHIAKGTLTRWSQLLDPAYSGKILLINDLRDAFGIGLKACGYSLNSRNPEELEKAYAFLSELKKHIRVFDVETIKQNLITEEVWISPIWDGNYLVAKEENPALEYVFPEDGAVYWVDSFVISAGAEHVENAYLFVNYMLRPDVAARCMKEYRYISPNLAGQKLLPEGTILLPPAHLLAKAEFIGDVGEALAIYAKLWEQLKTGK